MSTYDSPLKNLRIASPCSADWDAMSGDSRKRFCRECKLNVYNLSDMTWYDAENLLRLSEGRLCVRYFQRPDGTIMTQDCPVGWAKLKQRVSIFTAAACSVVLSLFGGLSLLKSFSREHAGRPKHVFPAADTHAENSSADGRNGKCRCPDAYTQAKESSDARDGHLERSPNTKDLISIGSPDRALRTR